MITSLANSIIPILTFIIIVYAMLKKVNIYDTFLEGIKEGFDISIEIFPSIFLMIVSVSVLVKSNFLNDLISLITIPFIPKEIIPLSLLRPISGSSSMMLLNNILSTYGPDSVVGRISSVITGSTDTTVYIVGLYLGSIKIKKIKYSLVVGLLADMFCIILSIIIVKYFWL